MSATEAWAQAKASGMAQNIHPETAKNMGIGQPIEIPKEDQNKAEPILPLPVPKQKASWSWLVHIVYLLGLAYCVYLLHQPRTVTETKTVEVEKIVEKPVEKIITKYVDRPVAAPQKVLFTTYTTDCNKYVHAGTCELVMAKLRSAQENQLKAIQQGKQPGDKIVL